MYVPFALNRGFKRRKLLQYNKLVHSKKELKPPILGYIPMLRDDLKPLKWFLSFFALEAHDLSRGLAEEQIINRTASAVFRASLKNAVFFLATVSRQMKNASYLALIAFRKIGSGIYKEQKYIALKSRSFWE